MERRQIIPGELVKVSTTTDERDEFARRLKQTHQTLMDLINMVHEMNGPARLEIADLVIETRTASGFDVPVTAGFYIGDIQGACKVLQERLKG